LQLYPAASAHFSPTLAINERVNQLWAAGQTVYHLGFGESRFPVHPLLAEALQQNIQRISYLPAQGLPELRTAVADFYTQRLGIAAAPAQVIVGPGSKSLIYAAQMALQGDLLLPTPSWVSYAPQARLLGKEVLRIPARAADGYAFDMDAFCQTLAQSKSAVRLLVLNSPSNPTGQMIDAALLQAIVDLCRQEQVFILSDEIYALTAHGHKPHLSPAALYPEGTIVFGGLSKHLSLGGWRLGVAITPPGADGEALMRQMRMIAGEIWSTPAAPVQYAAVVAYSSDRQLLRYIDECRQLHALRTQHLWSWLAELGVPCAQPDGAFYLFPNFDRWRESLARRGVHTSEQLATHLLEAYQIASLPGTAFGVPASELSLRLATSYVDMENEAKANALLAAYRNDPNPERLLANHHLALQQAIEQLYRFVESL
jgi:aspartate aminotransferase